MEWNKDKILYLSKDKGFSFKQLRGYLCKNHPLNFSAKLDFSYKLSFFKL